VTRCSRATPTHTRRARKPAETPGLREDARKAIHAGLRAVTTNAVVFCGSGATVPSTAIGIPQTCASRPTSTPLSPRDHILRRSAGRLHRPYEHTQRTAVARDDRRRRRDREIPTAMSCATAQGQARSMPTGRCASAASRGVQRHGIRTDAAGISDHSCTMHGALSFWDYAPRPYHPVDMARRNRTRLHGRRVPSRRQVHRRPRAHPGVLVVRRDLVRTPCDSARGGTVGYVPARAGVPQRSGSRARRAGTPNIIGSIRAGLAFQLRRVGTDLIQAPEEGSGNGRWRRGPCHRTSAAGDTNAARLSIGPSSCDTEMANCTTTTSSRCSRPVPGSRPVAAARCAGRRAPGASGIDSTARMRSAADHTRLRGHQSRLTRVNFNYLSRRRLHYIIRRSELVADHGWKLPPTTCSTRQRLVAPRAAPTDPPIRSLICATTRPGRCSTRRTHARADESALRATSNSGERPSANVGTCQCWRTRRRHSEDFRDVRCSRCPPPCLDPTQPLTNTSACGVWCTNPVPLETAPLIFGDRGAPEPGQDRSACRVSVCGAAARPPSRRR